MCSILHLFQFTTHVSIQISFFGRSALVMQLFAPAEGDLHLHQVSPEVHRGGDEGEPFLLNPPSQAFYLLLVGQKTPRTLYVVVMDVAVGIGLDVQTNECQHVAFDGHVRISEAETPVSQALHLGSHQGDATLQVFDYLVVEVCFFVPLEQLVGGFVVFHLFVPSDAKADLVPAGVWGDRADGIGSDGGHVVEVAAALDNGGRFKSKGEASSPHR